MEPAGSILKIPLNILFGIVLETIELISGGAAQGIRRTSEPALAGPVEIARIGESEGKAHLGRAVGAVDEVALCQLAAGVVDQLDEAGAFLGEAALQRALAHAQ